MYICPICNKEHDKSFKLSKHIQAKHKLAPKDIMFESYPDLFRECKHCGAKIKHYKADSQSKKFCNSDCSRLWRTSRKQSPETVAKRIRNTDQRKKEETRQNTMVAKYGQLYHYPDKESRSKKLSDALSGRKHSEEHSRNVIESKRKNGTLKHSNETKRKISNSIKLYYSNDNIDHASCMPKRSSSGGRGYKHGRYNGLYYRSSYELKFLELCDKYNVAVETAETKEFRIRYEYDGRKRYYYPDFYLTDYDVVVEVKPLDMLLMEINQIKLDHGYGAYRYWLVTEEELNDYEFANELQYLKSECNI